jgi:hypothetical protein
LSTKAFARLVRGTKKGRKKDVMEADNSKEDTVMIDREEILEHELIK